LLVTEMQNQDPTAQTDPDEYINQLVQVNSLEQLIDINQNLTTALGTSGSTPSGSTGSAQASAAKASVTGASPAGTTAAGASAMAHKAGAQTAAHAATSNPPGSSHAASTKPGSSTLAGISQFAQSVNAKRAPGNLSVPAAKPASHSVAHALDGHSHAKGIPGK
jgi:flagellar basal-body rod modification protein FlgD